MRPVPVTLALAILTGATARAGQPHVTCTPVETSCRMVTSHLTASLAVNGRAARVRLNRFWMCNLMFSPAAKGAVTSSALNPSTGEAKYRIELDSAVKTASDEGYDVKSAELTVSRDGTGSLQVFSPDGRGLGTIALNCAIQP